MSSSEPSPNGTPTLTKIGKLKQRINELQNQLEIAILDRQKSEDEFEDLVIQQAAAAPPRTSGHQVDAESGDLVAVLRHSGRSCATQKRLARLRERLPAWLARYRLELASVEEVD
jgi:hypothetical protein